MAKVTSSKKAQRQRKMNIAVIPISRRNAKPQPMCP